MVTKKLPAPWWAKTRTQEWLAAEKLLAAHILGPLDRYKVLELAPAGLPAAMAVTRFDLDPEHGRWANPVMSEIHHLPICDQCLDVLLWRFLPLSRHAWRCLTDEAVRCLKPGGRLLISTINPLQPVCWRTCGWRELARQTPEPGWPFGIPGLHLQISRGTGGRRPLQPIRVQLLLKTGDPRILLPLTRRRDKLVAVPSTAATRNAWCNSANRRAA